MRRVAYVILILVTLALVACESPQGEARADKFDRYFNQAWSLTQAERHQEAVPLYEKALEILPNDREKSTLAYNNLGWSLSELGRYQEAVVAYEQALELRPDWDLARNNLQVARSKLTESR